MAEQEQNKTEPATPFKLREARKRGQVAKSLEFNSWVMIGALTAATALFAESVIQHHLRVDRALFSRAHELEFSPEAVIGWLSGALAELGSVLVPLFLGVVAISVIANMVQTGPVFSVFALKPDPQRISPVAGFKRVFSLRLLFEAIKSILKIAVFGIVVYLVIRTLLPDMVRLMLADPDLYPRALLSFALRLALALVVVHSVIAVLDLGYSRWDYQKKMRMSRRELKEEIKRREGDPQIRSRIKELQRESAKRSQSLGRVPDADVLITNPSHLAVALLYQRGEKIAPEVIAKGSGELAAKMKYLARRHRVPVLREKDLARALFREVELDETIPQKFFGPVARILIWAYARKGRSWSRPVEGGAT